MKKFYLSALTIAISLCSCMNHEDADINNQDDALIKANAVKLLGSIDPSQDWNSITQGSINITADADLKDIEKVQILTESPFLNKEVRVLNEAKVTNGQTISLSFDAPNIYDKLVAACISKSGVYYIQVFDVNQKSVNFSNGSKARSNRAYANEVPTFTSIKLKSYPSINAKRAQAGEFKIGNTTYTQWNNSGWENERMWEPTDGQVFDKGWKMDTVSNKGIIFRDIDGFAEGEEENVKTIVNSFFYKYGSDEYSVHGKKNNAKIIRESNMFVNFNNYLETDGQNPLTLIPIQAYNEEFKLDHIFYYYFKAEDAEAMSEDAFVAYVKSLPKFKAIQIERVQSSDEAKAGAFFKRKEFLLPFYGDGIPTEGVNEASAIFPAGYKVGFLNMKSDNNRSINNAKHGCTYGDGRFNVEVNHIVGHYNSAIDKELGGDTKEGMQWDDPRIAVYSANGKTYMCFEDGADCNFSDMIIEVGGTKLVDEIPEPEVETYTMCFEDRLETADYDMNDVVLQAKRINETQIQLSLIALGANDKLMLQGVDSKLSSQELHNFFGIDPEQEKTFVNTQGSNYFKPVSDTITVDKSITIKAFLSGLSVKNLTTGKTISMPATGEPPYAVIVPLDFQYPLETVSIINAYDYFKNWAQNKTTSADWYLYPNNAKVYINTHKED